MSDSAANRQDQSGGAGSDVKSSEYVLVADDSTPNRAVMVLLLKKMGYSTLEAADGATAWKVVEENRDKNLVAIVSDLMMPKMDGLELLKRTRGDEKLATIPFVLVTAVSDQDYINEAKKFQVNGYILKPISYQRLAGKMQELFPQRQFPAKAA